MKIIRVPSPTAVVLAMLQRDIMTEQQLRARLPQFSSNQISAALIYLQRRKAIGFLADEVTTLYFATPDTDDRITTKEEYKPHTKRRKIREEKK